MQKKFNLSVTFRAAASFYITEAQNVTPYNLALMLDQRLPAFRPDAGGTSKSKLRKGSYNIMNFKRLGAGFLAAALSATSVGIYASAEEDAAMKQALTYVKQRIDIPKELTEFSYRTSTEQNKTRYTFTWSDKEGKGEYIQVSIVGKVIKSVNKWRNYDEDEWKTSFAKLSDEKILEAAKKYINELNPSIADRISIEPDDTLSITLWGPNATLGFHRVENGIPVYNQSGTVTVNKNTGELMYYYLNWVNGATFSDAKDAISVKDAQKSFKKLFPLEKVYTLEYDWENDKYTPHLIYRQTSSGQINAFTGELSTFDDYKSYGGDAGDDDAVAMETDDADVDANPHTGASNKAVTFSTEELEKLEKENSLIKAEDAIKDLRKMGVFYIPPESDITSQNCSYNEQLGAYIRNVTFRGTTDRYVDIDGTVEVPLDISEKQKSYTFYGNFAINAETGELLNFYCGAPDVGTNMDEKTYISKANSVMEKLIGDKWGANFKEMEAVWKNATYSKYDPETGKPIGEPRYTSMDLRSNRVANGILCVDESASLTFGNNGFVTSYRLNYHDDIEYPAPDKIITVNKAYSSYFKQVELGLRYRCAYDTQNKKVVSALVYDATPRLNIDAFSGKLTYANGAEYDPVQETGEYTDLENSKYKDIAEKLKKYGIVLMDSDNKLNENETITAADFRLLMNYMSIGGYDNSIKDDTKLTRRVAAYMLVAGKYGKELPEMTDIYKSKFSDVKDGSKYVGYIMIADASGLLPGNGTKYSPKAALTRGAALKMVYDYLSR